MDQMADPLSEAAFAAAMERAGLSDLTPEEREGIRLATRFAAGFAERVRAPTPPEVTDEPATRFAPLEGRS